MPHPPLLKRNEPHEEDTADAASSLFHQPLFRPFPLEGAATTTIQMYSYAATAFAPLRENERSRRRGSDGTPRTQSEDAAWWEGNVNNEREAAGACSVETKDDCCVASMKRWVTGDGRGVCVCVCVCAITGMGSLVTGHCTDRRTVRCWCVSSSLVCLGAVPFWSGSDSDGTTGKKYHTVFKGGCEWGDLGSCIHPGSFPAPPLVRPSLFHIHRFALRPSTTPRTAGSEEGFGFKRLVV